ncbi:MAG: carbohydrate kinase [Chloroflexota bacterium]|nr:carbohydrate kinase [Chloroflexota bacterium]
MKSILNLGELLIDIIPTAPIRLEEPCYSPHPGGAVANVAVATARLGGPSRFLGAVSEDPFGRLLVQVLVDNHVDTQYIHVVKGASTAVVLVTLHADGQRHFTFFRQGAADSQLQAEDLNWSAWHDAAICHVGGVLLSTEPARSATLVAMDHTRSVGGIVSFDVNIRPSLWASRADIRDTMTKAVERTDILKLSAEEAEFIVEQSSSPTEPFERSWLDRVGEMLLERGPRLVIITLGAHGALLLTAKHRVEVPALSVRPVDTTGAGDAFMGAVLYTLAQQGCNAPSDLQAFSAQDLNNLGSFASQVAGLSVTRFGGIPSFPYMNEVSDDTKPQHT